MQKNYELLYIVHPDLEGSTEKVTEKVTGFIKKAGGEITGGEDWGKRKLAYKMAKNDFGVYVLVNFTVDSQELHKVERDLRLAEEILRSMIVAVPNIKEIVLKPRKEKAEVKEEKAEEPASIIVAEEVPKKKSAVKKAPAKVEVKTNVVEKKTAVKKAASSAKGGQASGLKTAEADEAERLKKLDEKLDELLK